MQQSETIGRLSEALSKVQAVLEGAKLDSTNPFFKSKYSDLTSVWTACRKPLAENGLSVIQTCQSETADMVIVETMLSHNSGEWVRGRLAMRPVKADPQGVGSCITYARRYSLAAIVGVAPEDDDGNIASGKSDKPETRHTTHTKTETKAPEKPPQETSPPKAGTDTATLSAKDNLKAKMKAYLKARNADTDNAFRALLTELTEFPGKDRDTGELTGKMVYIDDIDDKKFSDKWALTAYGKLKKLIEEEERKGANDMQDDDVRY